MVPTLCFSFNEQVQSLSRYGQVMRWSSIAAGLQAHETDFFLVVMTVVALTLPQSTHVKVREP